MLGGAAAAAMHAEAAAACRCHQAATRGPMPPRRQVPRTHLGCCRRSARQSRCARSPALSSRGCTSAAQQTARRCAWWEFVCRCQWQRKQAGCCWSIAHSRPEKGLLSHPSRRPAPLPAAGTRCRHSLSPPAADTRWRRPPLTRPGSCHPAGTAPPRPPAATPACLPAARGSRQHSLPGGGGGSRRGCQSQGTPGCAHVSRV